MYGLVTVIQLPTNRTPCFNAADTIAIQLKALANQHWSEPWEVIVSDNGSTDGSLTVVEQCKGRLPDLHIVDSSDRKGAANARNVGAAAAKGNALVFVDADDEVAPGWLAAMSEALSKHDFVGGQNEHWNLNEPWVVKCFNRERNTGVFENHPYLPLVGGNNLGIKRSLHNMIGGFDESILILEDVDYCWRIQEAAGIKPHYVPDALLHFRLRKTLREMYHRAWNMGSHEYLLYMKNRPPNVTWKTFVRASVELSLQLLLLQVRDKVSLGKWLRSFAWRGGQLQGCIKYRYQFLFRNKNFTFCV